MAVSLSPFLWPLVGQLARRRLVGVFGTTRLGQTLWKAASVGAKLKH